MRRTAACAAFVAGLAIGVVCTGCGPTYPPQPSLAERCQGEPICMLIGQQVAADEAAQAGGAPPASQPQRVFIRRWLVPGGRNSPAPIGYIDY